MFAAYGRRTGEGNLSDTETASQLHLVESFSPQLIPSGHVSLVACPPLVLSLCCCSLLLFVLRVWNETSGTPAVCAGQRDPLKGNHTIYKGLISYTVI